VKSALPATSGSPFGLRLGRFTIEGADSVEAQCQRYRSDVQLYDRFRAVYLRLFRGQPSGTF
jgi:hypothetical protein